MAECPRDKELEWSAKEDGLRSDRPGESQDNAGYLRWVASARTRQCFTAASLSVAA